MTTPTPITRLCRTLAGASLLTLLPVSLSAQVRPPEVSGPPGSVPSILPPPVETLGGIPMITPSIETEVREQMAAGRIAAPPGFDLGIYATPPVVYSSVAVAAAPDGTTYVGLDGNLSISQFARLGRIVRLRDLNGDGVADEVKAFVPDIDSVRGLVWNHDHLIVMHAPNISAFYDRDGDGVAEEQKLLVSGVGLPVEEIRVDHGQNGIEVGIDGWIYLAIGDEGIRDAVGADGRHIQLYGGGVVRFRPDGTELEVWAIGTRNIYGMAVGPLLDVIARDNTNDGFGWNVRMHHISGLTDHGYPSRFVNFQDEIVQPLAEYPGGSGTGGLWLDEPTMPAEWNNIPITVDWGQGAAYRHQLTDRGATFSITNDVFIRAPFAVDLDVDANGVIYLVSTRHGGYRWVNPEWHGLMLRIAPTGARPQPLPDFDRAGIAELVRLHESPSQRRRLEAQRAILRRPNSAAEAAPLLEALARDGSKDLRYRVAALFTLKQLRGSAANPAIGRMVPDPSIAAWALRALGDAMNEKEGVPLELVAGSLRSADPRVRKEALIALARLGANEFAGQMAPLLGDADPIVAHTAMQGLRQLRAADAAFAVLDSTASSPAMRGGALSVVGSFHDERTVEGLLERIGRERDASRRAQLAGTVARLSRRETDWNGDWWGTRPDTTGPYFDPEPWSETARIQEVLTTVLDRAGPEETMALGLQFQRMGYSVGAAVSKFLDYAGREPGLLPPIVSYFATVDRVPGEAVPVIAEAARGEGTPHALRAQAVAALAKADRRDAWEAIAPALQVLQSAGAPPEPPPPGVPASAAGGGNQAAQRRNLARSMAEQARSAVMDSPYLDRILPVMAERAARVDGDQAEAADAMLLAVASRRIGDPAPTEAAQAALDRGWTDPRRRAQIIAASGDTLNLARALPIADALEDPNPAVAEAARVAVFQLGIKPDELRADAALPRIGSMDVDAVLDQVDSIAGDRQRGQRLAQELGCVACHTFNANAAPKGPFLGAIGGIMRRREIAEAILDPNRTISQGFHTQSFELKNGDSVVGFVVREAADALTVRDIAAREVRIPTDQIASREQLDISLMPAGLASELSLPQFASLLDYLAGLGANN